MLSEKLKIYGVWVEDQSRPHGGVWARDSSGRIFEMLSRGAAVAQAREWNHPSMRAAEIGDDGFPVDAASTTKAEGIERNNA